MSGLDAVALGLALVGTGSWMHVHYYWGNVDRLVPFVGGNLGYQYGNRGRDDTWGFGPEAGIKYYLQEKAFIFGMAEYRMPFQGKTFKEGFWNLTLGLGLNL